MPAAALARRLKVSFLVACAATFGATLAVAGGGDAKRAVDPAEEAKVELGRRLFFDPAVSRAGMRSCADCHDPAHGYSDKQALSRDDRGPTKRHSQTLIDGGDNPSAHWDGEFRRIEDLVMARLSLAGRKGGGHGLGSERAAGSSDTASAGGSYGGGSGGGRGAGAAASTGTTNGSPYGQGGGAADAGMSDGTAAGMSDGPTAGGSYGGMDDDSSTDDPAMDGDEPQRSCPPPTGDPENGYRSPMGAGGTSRQPEDPPTEASAAPEATGTGTAGGAQAPPVGGAMPGAGRPDAAGAPPAGATAPRPDPYADDAFGTSPDAALEFVALDVDLARLPAVGATLEAAGRYREAFTAAFGSPQITTQRIADAIGTHCRAIRSGRSAYDRFAAGEEAALSPAAKRGLELFKGAAGCVSCHSMTGRRAAFTDYRFHDTGVSWKASPSGDDGDAGAMGASSRPQDRRAFKTPTLRDVARRGPFMHDGSVATLEGAVRHYLSGSIGDPMLDEKMPKIVGTDGEVADLVAFLKSLTSDVRPGSATEAWAARAKSTRLTFVDADGKPMANTAVTLAPTGDRVPGAPAARSLTLRTDEDGRVEFAPSSRTHVRVVLEGGLRPIGGALVPDTCRAATIEIPVRGHCRVLAILPAGKPAPEAMVAEHPEAKFLPDRRTPRTILRLEAADSAPDGRVIAMYAAPMRVDVPARSVLKLPATFWGLDRLRVVLSPDDVVKVDLAKRR